MHKARLLLMVLVIVVSSLMIAVPAQAKSCKDAKNVRACCERKTTDEARENRCINRNGGGGGGPGGTTGG